LVLEHFSSQCTAYQPKFPCNREALLDNLIPNFYANSICRKQNSSHLKKYRGVRLRHNKDSANTIKVDTENDDSDDDDIANAKCDVDPEDVKSDRLSSRDRKSSSSHPKRPAKATSPVPSRNSASSSSEIVVHASPTSSRASSSDLAFKAPSPMVSDHVIDQLFEYTSPSLPRSVPAQPIAAKLNMSELRNRPTFQRLVALSMFARREYSAFRTYLSSTPQVFV
jgi:hypothetical protein